MIKNIFLVDGDGYIGSHTFVALRSASFNPVVLDDFRASSPVMQGFGNAIGILKMKAMLRNLRKRQTPAATRSNSTVKDRPLLEAVLPPALIRLA